MHAGSYVRWFDERIGVRLCVALLLATRFHRVSADKCRLGLGFISVLARTTAYQVRFGLLSLPLQHVWGDDPSPDRDVTPDVSRGDIVITPSLISSRSRALPSRRLPPATCIGFINLQLDPDASEIKLPKHCLLHTRLSCSSPSYTQENTFRARYRSDPFPANLPFAGTSDLCPN